jgi:hypothetical protein
MGGKKKQRGSGEQRGTILNVGEGTQYGLQKLSKKVNKLHWLGVEDSDLGGIPSVPVSDTPPPQVLEYFLWPREMPPLS